MARIDVGQANFLLPIELIDDLRRYVPRREQSKVVAEALRKELKRLRLRSALDESFGAWANEPHSELEQGVEHYVRQSRRSSRGSRLAER